MATLGGVVQPSDYRLAHTLLAYWRNLLFTQRPRRREFSEVRYSLATPKIRHMGDVPKGVKTLQCPRKLTLERFLKRLDPLDLAKHSQLSALRFCSGWPLVADRQERFFGKGSPFSGTGVGTSAR